MAGETAAGSVINGQPLKRPSTKMENETFKGYRDPFLHNYDHGGAFAVGHRS